MPSKKIKKTEFIVHENLLIRLRYLFGPGTRADVLYFILVLSQQEYNPYNLEISTPVISRNLGYNASSISRTLKDFEEASIVKEKVKVTDGKKVLFITDKRIFQDNEIIDKCYINWFPIVGMAFYLRRLMTSIQERQPIDESVIKSRFVRWIEVMWELAQQACIPLAYVPSIEGPLKDISLDHIINSSTRMSKEVFDFITSPKWPTSESRRS